MSQPLEITLRTLTPLWTGGVDQTADHLHETGLIGSLRWWYEALVRGLGGKACDPTEHACQFDEEKYRKSKATNQRDRLIEAGVCDACQLFGCTGWARKFRLSVSSEGEKLFDNKQDILIPSGRKHQTKKGERAGGWFVFSESRINNVKLTLTSLREADLRPLHLILAIVSQHASLGPKGASGYGIIQTDVKKHEYDWIQDFASQQPARNNTLPDFRDFFFARFQFQEPTDTNWWQNINGIEQAIKGKLNDGSSPPPLRRAQQQLDQMKQQGILPIAPAIRNWLRHHWQHGLSDKQAHSVFGEAQAVCPNCYQPGFKPDKKNDKRNWCPNCQSSFDKGKEIPTTASKIQVSYAYRIDNNLWEFRIWGWLPCNIFDQNKRDTFLESLHTALKQNGIWQFVFGASQITPNLIECHASTCNQTDGKAYLNALLGGAQ